MRYLLHPRGAGEEPGWAMVPGDYAPQPGEAVVDRRPEPGEVWDATSGSLRQRTDAEKLALAKQGKRGELTAAFDREGGADFSTPWVAVGVLAATPADPRITALKTRTTKLRDKLAAVEAATTEAEVRAVSWT